MEGKERLCLAQISNTLLKDYSYNEIHNRRVALGITCVQCTPVQVNQNSISLYQNKKNDFGIGVYVLKYFGNFSLKSWDVPEPCQSHLGVVVWLPSVRLSVCARVFWVTTRHQSCQTTLPLRFITSALGGAADSSSHQDTTHPGRGHQSKSTPFKDVCALSTFWALSAITLPTWRKGVTSGLTHPQGFLAIC